MNQVILCGRFSRDHNLRYTQSGMAVLNNSVAVDDGYGDKKKTYFPNIVIFGKQAEATEQHTGKGNKVLIRGKLTTGSYDKSDGTKVYTTDVIVDEIEFLEFKDKGGQQAPDPFEGAGEPVEFSESDLPF